MGLIKAVNRNGLEGYFTELAWKVGKPENHGWRKVGVTTKAVMTEAEEIEVVSLKVTDIPEATDDDLYPTDDEIRDFLKENDVKFHPKLGSKKLRDLYDANKK